MRFVVCWACGYSTAVKGGGVNEQTAAVRIRNKHDCPHPKAEIITKDKL